MSTSTTKRRLARGFTLLEVMIMSVVLGGILAAVAPVLEISSDVIHDSKRMAQAENDHRRNLEVIANVLRTIDVNTLGNLDADDKTPNPSFVRVMGADQSEVNWSDLQDMAWEATSGTVGERAQGAVYLRRYDNAGNLLPDREMLGRNVPSNGFVLRQEGRNLVIELTTYHHKDGEDPVWVSTATTVAMRN